VDRASFKIPHKALSALGILLTGFSASIAWDTDIWPFSNYPMYSYFRLPEYRSFALVGVTKDGEVLLNRSIYWAPFDGAKLQKSLIRMSQLENPENHYKPALEYLFTRYNERRGQAHSGPHLKALRLYHAGGILADLRSLIPAASLCFHFLDSA
jgi:hypothetical protein